MKRQFRCSLLSQIGTVPLLLDWETFWEWLPYKMDPELLILLIYTSRSSGGIVAQTHFAFKFLFPSTLI